MTGWTQSQCAFSCLLTLKMKIILNPVLHEPMEKKNPMQKHQETLRGSAAASWIIVTIGSTAMRA
jgi:hypothetical protein